MHDSVSGRDVVVAIIGGTLLGLALTRPRLGWAQRLEESYRWSVEVVTTIVAFVMGGYAYGIFGGVVLSNTRSPKPYMPGPR
jgi:hypothetical protein